MADAGDVVINVAVKTDDVKKGIEKTKSSIGDLRSGINEFVKDFATKFAAVGGVVAAFAAKSVQAYGEQESAVAALNQALANQGRFTQEVSDDLVDYATQLQAVTTFADENIIAAQAQLAAFGLEGQALKDTTKATLDLATAKKIDLQSAASLLGKAFVGETGTLSRYGIMIKEGVPKAEKFAEALGKVNQMFGGQAEVARQTTLGSIEGLKNAFSDLQEEIGAMLVGSWGQLIGQFTAFIQHVTTGLVQIRQFSMEFKSFGAFLQGNFILVLGSIAIAVLDLLNKIPFVGQLIKLLGGNIAETQRLIEEQVVAMQSAKMVNQEWVDNYVVNEVRKQSQIKVTNAVIQQEEESTTQHNLIKSDERIQKAIEEGRQKNEIATFIKDHFMVTTQEWTDAAGALIDGMFANFGNGVADMVLEGKKFSQVMKALWKDMARAFISEVARMIAKWLAFQALKSAAGGGFGGFFATGGIINEPSVITGLRSGISHIAGEAGPEAVVPIPSGGGGAQRNAALAEVQGGQESQPMNVTVQINGMFIEGNESKWQSLIRSKLIPEIRRITQSVPTGPFNRVRGAP